MLLWGGGGVSRTRPELGQGVVVEAGVSETSKTRNGPKTFEVNSCSRSILVRRRGDTDAQTTLQFGPATGLLLCWHTLADQTDIPGSGPFTADGQFRLQNWGSSGSVVHDGGWRWNPIPHNSATRCACPEPPVYLGGRGNALCDFRQRRGLALLKAQLEQHPDDQQGIGFATGGGLGHAAAVGRVVVHKVGLQRVALSLNTHVAVGEGRSVAVQCAGQGLNVGRKRGTTVQHHRRTTRASQHHSHHHHLLLLVPLNRAQRAAAACLLHSSSPAGRFSSVLDPNPFGVGQGVRRGGGVAGITQVGGWGALDVSLHMVCRSTASTRFHKRS